MSWQSLSDEPGFEKILEGSFRVPLFIFKHSTRCGKSRYVLDSLEVHGFSENSDAFLLDVIAHRVLARHVAEKLDVVHESPQLLLIHEGECVWAEDHLEIDPLEALSEKARYGGQALG